MRDNRVVVASSCITAACFSPSERILRLEFRNGLTYDYFAVPSDVFDMLLAADSKGAFVARFIRGHFSFRRVPNSSDLTQ